QDRDTRAAIQSVYAHLVALDLSLHLAAPASFVRAALVLFTQSRPEFPALRAPANFSVTVLSMLDRASPSAFFEASRNWGQAVWDDWKAYHPTIRGLREQLLKDMDSRR